MTNLGPILIVLISRGLFAYKMQLLWAFPMKMIFFSYILYSTCVIRILYKKVSSLFLLWQFLLNLEKLMLAAWVVSFVVRLLRGHNVRLRWWKYCEREENVQGEPGWPESIEPTVPDPSQINLRFNFIDCFERGSAYIQSHEIKTFPKLFIR